MPPKVGVAMRLAMSIPDPVDNIMGMSESTVVATVINLGRKRKTEPSSIDS